MKKEHEILLLETFVEPQHIKGCGLQVFSDSISEREFWDGIQMLLYQGFIETTAKPLPGSNGELLNLMGGTIWTSDRGKNKLVLLKTGGNPTPIQTRFELPFQMKMNNFNFFGKQQNAAENSNQKMELEKSSGIFGALLKFLKSFFGK